MQANFAAILILPFNIHRVVGDFWRGRGGTLEGRQESIHLPSGEPRPYHLKVSVHALVPPWLDILDSRPAD